MPTQERILTERQLNAFNYDTPRLYGIDQILVELLRKFVGDEFSFLDVGAGNGMFSDYVLEQFPKSECDAVDAAQSMLLKNRSSDRKRVHLLDAMEIGQLGKTFNVVFCNFLIHHLIGNNFSASREIQKRFLMKARSVLKPGGKIFVLEELKNGYAHPDLPNWLIYNLTSSTVLAPLTRRMGANTAGTGVCFLSRFSMTSLLKGAGLRVLEVTERVTPPPTLWRYFLGIRTMESGVILVAG